MAATVKSSGKRAENEDLLQIYFNQIKAYPLLETDEEVCLTKLAQQGNKAAKNKLINGNLRLVIKIARMYTAPDVPFLDLIQEGNMGLIHAAEKFDYAKNVRFCTYAGWWIRQHIIRYLTNKRRIVRLPHRKEEMLRKVQRTYHALSQTLMHQPRTEDIAGELGIPVKDIEYVINMTSGPLPLELDIQNDDNNTVMEIHEDYTYSPERNLFRQYYREGARRFLDRLKDREKQVISYRYQLDQEKPCTLKEIAAEMKLSPETIRQIELKALAKIRGNKEELHQFGFSQAM